MPDDRPLPRYADLPVRPGAPPRSAWGLWGDDDQLGALNLLTPERIAGAARLVQHGKLFPLNWEMELPNPSIGRGRPRHTVWSHRPWGFDDIYDNYYPQSSSQWDAFSHAGAKGYGWYNGAQEEDILGPEARNGIHTWARRGIAGRAVLLDVGRWFEHNGREFDYDDWTPITVADLEAVIAYQGTAIETGDILLVRTGWMAYYLQQDNRWRERVARRRRVPGLESCLEMVEFLWDLHVAAVAADNFAVETYHDPEHTLHAHLLALCGVPLGEFWYLEGLAADCAEDRRYESFFVSTPLNKFRGAGSPPNATAIK
jgi:kynurenine formamidase